MTKVIPLLLASLVTTSATAEIYKCNGQWTNRPCNGVVEKKFDEITETKPSRTSTTVPTEAAAPEPFAPRYEAIRKLKKESDTLIKAGKIGASRGEYEAVKKLCMERARPFAECKEAVSSTLAALEKKNTPQE